MSSLLFSSIVKPGVDQGYYFFPLLATQTAAQIQTFLSAGQSASYWTAKKTAAQAYTLLGSETVISTPASMTPFTLNYTANAASAPTPYGVMLRVSGVDAAASANSPYAVRVATRTDTIDQALNNTEVLSRYYPSGGLLQVATNVSVKILVKDFAGNIVPNEPVDIAIKANNNDGNTFQMLHSTTAFDGTIAFVGNFPACTGTVESANSYGPTGSPADHYKGTAQNASVTATLPNALKATSATQQLKRICSETYLGNY